MPEEHPAHTWFDIARDGTLNPIDAPVDAVGEGIGQLLASHPVWPDRQGVLHTLPQIQTPWRAHYLRYHKLLAEAGRDTSVSDQLETTIARSPVFRELHIGRVDRVYCQFLSKLQDKGLLSIDGARTKDEHDRHQQVVSEIMAELFGLPVPRKHARPG